MVSGREEIFFGNEFAVSAARALPDVAVRYYIDMLRNEHSLRGSFGWYRELDTTITQNEQRKIRRLAMPVLAIGAQYSTGDTVGAAMNLVADDVQTVVIPGSGHWIAEEAPEALLTAVSTFLAPYREGKSR
jgi:pimeloyl-ACP methyl ester carboxylesterase